MMEEFINSTLWIVYGLMVAVFTIKLWFDLKKHSFDIAMFLFMTRIGGSGTCIFIVYFLARLVYHCCSR